MKHDCPYCGTQLARRLIRSVPAPGERKFLPNRAIPVCPVCHGKLAPQTHWSEGLLGCFLGLSFLGLLDSRSSLKPGVFIVLNLALLGITAIGALVFHFRYWRHVQRYKPYRP